MHSVTSNAVAKYVSNRIPSYTSKHVLSGVNTYTLQDDSYIEYLYTSTNTTRNIRINGNVVSERIQVGSNYIYVFYGYAKKGSVITREDNTYLVGCTVYGLV